MKIPELVSSLTSEIKSAIRKHTESIGKTTVRNFPMEITSVEEIWFNPIESNSIDIVEILNGDQIELNINGKVVVFFKNEGGGSSRKELDFHALLIKAIFDPKIKQFAVDVRSNFSLSYQ
jgi:hypothetical protein